MKTWIKTIGVMTIMLTFLGDDCSGIAVEDSSFQLWTSDTSLAAWDVTAGSIRKAATWSEADPGVELVDVPTEIAQRLTGSSSCARVTIMGKVEDGASLAISTSAGGSFRVPALDWKEFTDYISLPNRYAADASESSSPTLRIRKSGQGTVILSRVEVQAGTGCGPSTYRED